MSSLTERKQQILQALQHPEAEEGLYFENLYQLHEEDERIAVAGSEIEILDAVRELANEKKLVVNDTGKRIIVSLPKRD